MCWLQVQARQTLLCCNAKLPYQTTTQQLFHNQLSCVLLLLWRQLFDEVWLLERELFYVIIYFKMLWVGCFSNFYITYYFTIFQSFNSSLKINLVSVYNELLQPRGCWKRVLRQCRLKTINLIKQLTSLSLTKSSAEMT